MCTSPTCPFWKRDPGAYQPAWRRKLYGTPATALPLDESFDLRSSLDTHGLAEDLAGLGYPGFSHLHAKCTRNPARVLLDALGQNDLESRLVKALPWVILRYPALNWEWLVPRAKLYTLQNRLGYVTHLGCKLAESKMPIALP